MTFLGNLARKVIVFLVIGCTFSVLVAHAATVYPTENLDFLKNPNRGFVAYSTGEITSTTFSEEVWDRITTAYIRIRWSLIEPSERVFDWSIFDNSIATCAAKGVKLGLSITPCNVYSDTVYAQNCPLWVFDAGAAYTTELGGKVKVPVWDDDVYKEELQYFITALKNRYDGNSNIAFFDITNYGNWGEWHLYLLPNSVGILQEEKEEHIDMWSGFSKYLQIPNASTLGSLLPHAEYAIDTYKAGIKNCGCMDPSVPNQYLSLTASDDIAPAMAEWRDSYTNLVNNTLWQRPFFEKTIKDGKASYVGLSVWDGNALKDIAGLNKVNKRKEINGMLIC